VVNGAVDRELLNWCLTRLQGHHDYFWASVHRPIYQFEFGQLPQSSKAVAKARELLGPAPDLPPGGPQRGLSDTPDTLADEGG
jgi:hypothetical protein